MSSGSRVVGQTKYYTEDLRGICRLTFDLVASCRWWALDRVLPRSQVVDKAAGTANVLAVQDIAAPVQVVLDRIVDFKAYPKMVGDVVECGNYEEHTHKNKTQTMKTHLVLKAAIMKFGGYFVHTYYPPPLSSVRSGWCCFLLYPSSGYPRCKPRCYLSLTTLRYFQVTWTLDYSRLSDYVDSVGYWHVAPHPDFPGTYSRVYYSVMFPEP